MGVGKTIVTIGSRDRSTCDSFPRPRRLCDCYACGACYRRYGLPRVQQDDTDRLTCSCAEGLDVSILPEAGGCRICRKRLLKGATVVSCGRCNFDACIECAASSLEEYNMSARTCPGRHGLERMLMTTKGYACDFCRRPFKVGTSVFSCR